MAAERQGDPCRDLKIGGGTTKDAARETLG